MAGWNWWLIALVGILLIAINYIHVWRRGDTWSYLDYIWMNLIFILVVYLWAEIDIAFIQDFNLGFLVNSINVNFWTNNITLFIIAISLIYCFAKSKTYKIDFEVAILLGFSILGLLMLYCANDFMFFFLSLEIYTLPTYILITSRDYSIQSTEAGLKYFIFGTCISALFLFGISCIYYVTGSLKFNELNSILFIYYGYAKQEYFIQLGMILILFSLFFKVAAVPFHAVIPDVYEGAPILITFFLNVLPKIALFPAFNNLLHSFLIYERIWTNIIYLIALISIIIGNFALIYQTKHVRLFAYSMVVNSGFFLLGFVSSNKETFLLMFLYLIIYSFIMFGIFCFLTNIRFVFNNEVFDKIVAVLNMFSANTASVLVYMVFLFSLGSVPPLLGFFGKIALFYGVVSVNVTLVSLVFLLFGIITLMAYLRILKVIFFVADDHWSFFVPFQLSASFVMALIFALNLMVLFLPWNFLLLWIEFYKVIIIL